jgi:hypothetical protein
MSSASNRGKAFEALVSRSLHAMPGWSMRIQDGGAASRLATVADFFYGRDDVPSWYAIEAKSVRAKSFPLRNIGYGQPCGQLARLSRFQRAEANRRAFIALSFEGRPYLVPLDAFVSIADACAALGRQSVPEAALEGYAQMFTRNEAGARVIAFDFDGEEAQHGA